MTEYWDFALAPFRKFLGPVYDAYRKMYTFDYEEEIEPQLVSTLEGNPQPDFSEDRRHRSIYGVYGPPDNMVKAGIVAQPTKVRMQSKPVEPVRGLGCKRVIPAWLPKNVEMHETFVEMPFTQKTNLRCSTVSTRHS